MGYSNRFSQDYLTGKANLAIQIIEENPGISKTNLMTLLPIPRYRSESCWRKLLPILKARGCRVQMQQDRSYCFYPPNVRPKVFQPSPEHLAFTAVKIYRPGDPGYADKIPPKSALKLIP
jgi:hypothetical protein